MMRKYGVWIALIVCVLAALWVSGLEEEDSPAPTASATRTPSSNAAGRKPAATAAPSLTAIEAGLPKREAISRLRQDPFAAVSFAPPPPPPAAPPKPTAPPLRFKYQGQLREGNVPVVFLDLDGQMLTVRVGDTLGDQYKVLAITERTMQFEYLPLAQQQTLNFGR